MLFRDKNEKDRIIKIFSGKGEKAQGHVCR
jgi:hypothetical protein